MFAQLALSGLPYSIDRPYDYLVPEELQSDIQIGMRVIVPFSRGNRETEGIVLSLSEESRYEDCKPILRLADREALLSEQQLKLAYFIRERCFCRVYDAVRAMIPAGFWLDQNGRHRTADKQQEMVRLILSSEDALAISESWRTHSPKQAEILNLLSSFEVLPVKDLLHFTGAGRASLKALCAKDMVELFQREVYRRPERIAAESVPLPQLNEEQQGIFHRIQDSRNSGKPGLLFGVTGSGKTSIYAHLIDAVLKQGKSAILLVPEIALTPQMVTDFSSWFGDRIALQHSALSPGERYDEWKRIRRGEAQLVIGTRSAVFAPVQNLDLIIIDEEQEESYRSDAAPRYHAREIARYRCIQENAFLLLGSATPDLRSRYLAEKGDYSYYHLPNRFNRKPLPKVTIVDMKQELKNGNTGNLSTPLLNAIQSRMDRGEQSILFLNRRGTSKLVTCSLCGYVYRCPHCSVAMTWHASHRRLVCHYCGFSRPVDRYCPDCGGELSFIGAGTQKIEEELHRYFPETEILRVDADSVIPAGSHRALFRRFTEERIPIMIGTQMVAKGLNFESVTLVGVVSADQSLYSNDFRAGERCFDLLTQVIGRCGRADLAGEAIIQTFTPDNQIVRLAARQDYDAFYVSELEMRKLQSAPPFCDRIAFSASAGDEEKLIAALRFCKEQLRILMQGTEGTEIQGPIPMPVVKVSDRYRYRLQISCRLNKQVRQALSTMLVSCGREPRFKGIYFYIESDPGP